MLREILNKSYFSFQEGFDDWRDAVRYSYKPLYEEGIVSDSYINSVINCVEEYGPYIVITRYVAMPHSTSEGHACKGSAVSFMRVKTPVKFDPNDEEKDVKLFFSLAVADNNEHIKNIQNLMEILVNEELISELLLVENEEMFKELVEKYE